MFLRSMRIAPRIISIFLPLFLAPMIFIAYAATTTARSAITYIATNFLQFKADQLLRFADSENQLLVGNGLSSDSEYVSAAKQSVANYAVGLVRTSGELIAGFDGRGVVQFSTSALQVSPRERRVVSDLIRENRTGWQELELGGTRRVAVVARFASFDWTLMVTEPRDTFFRYVRGITTESATIAAVALAAVIGLIIVFTRLLLAPLNQVAGAMRDIVRTGDLDRRVTVRYSDEVGELGESFNAMTSALKHAYGEIKNYALAAAVARKREAKIRNVFQKYVPNHVIEQFFASPESMLVGQDRKLSILFSDIVGFTSMSERMTSGDIVESLNQYFGRMVEAIMRNEGLVDKYIGDAIMAIFGAPVDDQRSCFHSLLAAFDMLDELGDFNEWHDGRGYSPVHMGIGINYGSVTIGNIGSERKMDYTVIGDMVNVASRLEGLTRHYGEALLISESVQEHVREELPCRLVDRVQVKGRSAGLAIYTARRSLATHESEAWEIHARAMELFYRRSFDDARRAFAEVRDALPGDPIASIFVARCDNYLQEPPPDEWTGEVAYTAK